MTAKTDPQADAKKAHAAHQKVLAAEPASYLEPVWDDPADNAPGGISHVLARRSVNNLADLEGERIPAEDVHPNGQPVRPALLETVLDPLVEADKDTVYAPLAKDADTVAATARKQREAGK